MEIKNDIKWLKERKFVTEIGTPDKLNTRNELRSYITQVGIGFQLGDEVSDEGGSSDMYSSQYLTFEVLGDGTFSFSKDGLSYSLDNGTSWNTLSANTNITVSNGDKVLFKGEYTNTTASIGKFAMRSKFNISGNIMSLLFGDNFADKTDLTGYKSVFDHLFEGTSVVDASKLVLPATILSEWCYGRMLYNCTSLTTAPVLPATVLASNCYNSMFYGCTSLIAAPELPATTLAGSCYSNMFSGCTSLIAAPELPATTLADGCYGSMFFGCSNLNYIKAMFATTPSTSYTRDWVSDVSSTGTFVKNADATWDVRGSEGIPTGWTVETATS